MSSDVALSAGQGALARAIGYTDSHELQGFAGQSQGWPNRSTWCVPFR